MNFATLMEPKEKFFDMAATIFLKKSLKNLMKQNVDV